MAKKAYSHQKSSRHSALTAVGSNQKTVLALAEALIAEAIADLS